VKNRSRVALLIGLALLTNSHSIMAESENQNLCEKIGSTLTYKDYKPFSHGKTWHGFELFDAKPLSGDQIKAQYNASDDLSDSLDELTEYPGQTILYSSKYSVLHIVSHFEGTAACRDEVYFLQHGMRQSDIMDAPKLYKSRTHDLCNDSASLFISSYERQPVIIRMDEPDGELLTTLTFAPWEATGWGSLCQIMVTRSGKNAIQVKADLVEGLTSN